MWTKLMVYLAANWKTTLGGFLLLILAILMGAGIIPGGWETTIMSILTGLGLIVAKDAGKT
jgi:hypothetical protein